MCRFSLWQAHHAWGAARGVRRGFTTTRSLRRSPGTRTTLLRSAARQGYDRGRESSWDQLLGAEPQFSAEPPVGVLEAATVGTPSLEVPPSGDVCPGGCHLDGCADGGSVHSAGMCWAGRRLRMSEICACRAASVEMYPRRRVTTTNLSESDSATPISLRCRFWWRCRSSAYTS